jgi:hypothetical protein
MGRRSTSFGKPIPSQLGLADRPLFGGDGVARVIFPDSIYLKESFSDALLSDPELLYHPTTGSISGNDRNFDPMQGNGFKGKAQRDNNRFGHKGSTGLRLIYPITD